MSTPKKAIVIVDDEKPYLDLLGQLLQSQFANPVLAFHRPADAIAALAESDPGIILTDFYMPDLTGLEFILCARRIRPQVPFLIVSGHGIHLSGEDFSHVPELKAVMSKPVSSRQLREAVLTHWPEAVPRGDPALAGR